MIGPKRFSIPTFITVCGMMLSPIAHDPVLAQGDKQELPLVIAAEMPLYPVMARAARIQGIVKMRVTTDGKKVTSVEAESGPAMLVKFTKENILTWRFSDHKPMTFVTTFEYVIRVPGECFYTNGRSVIDLPLSVRLSAKGVSTCDPAVREKEPRP